MCAPNEILRPIDKMNGERKTEFIVNACHCKYVHESKISFDSLSDFIFYNHGFASRTKIKKVVHSVSRKRAHG